MRQLWLCLHPQPRNNLKMSDHHKHGSSDPRKDREDARERVILEEIMHELRKLAEKVIHMSLQIDNLKAQVATTIQLETQAIAILNAGGGSVPASDLAQVVLLSNQLKVSSDALAAALGASGGTGGGVSTETQDAQSLITAAQQASTIASDPVQVVQFVTKMQAAAASLSSAFTRNSPPLSSTVTQQEISSLQTILTLISNLSSVTTDPNQVLNLCAQIQTSTATLAQIIAANPRGPVPGAPRR